MRTPTRIALYSHDTHGLGHLRRCLKIARALSDSLDCLDGLLVTGSPWSRMLPAPRGFRYARLPPVLKVGPSRYRSRIPGQPLDAVLRLRRDVVACELRNFGPELVVIDNVPCGLGGELLPVLPVLKQAGCRIVLSMRDVLDEITAIRAEWRRSGAQEAVASFYDEVWLFGGHDSASFEFLPPSVRLKTVLCGYLGHDAPVACALANGPARPLDWCDGPRVLVTGGGGGDAGPLVTTYVDAVRMHAPRARHRIVLGPDFPQDRIPAGSDLASLGVRILRFEPDMAAAMREADVVVAMAGYNTVTEAMAAGKRLVLVPRLWPRREQLLRARSLAASGRAEFVHPADLTPTELWRAVERAVARPAPQPLPLVAGPKIAERAQALLAPLRRMKLTEVRASA